MAAEQQFDPEGVTELPVVLPSGQERSGEHLEWIPLLAGFPVVMTSAVGYVSTAVSSTDGEDGPMCGICWHCHWGWPRVIGDIYHRAEADIDEIIYGMHTTGQEPACGWITNLYSGEYALEFGPAHVVWSDENFDLAESCLKDCDRPEFAEWPSQILDIVRRSLRELVAVPDELKDSPPGYDGVHPECFPPPQHWEVSREYSP